MAVRVEWDDETRSAIIWTLVGRWTWDEFAVGWNEMNSLLKADEGNKPDIIYDVRLMTMMPPDVVTRLKQGYLHLPPNVRRVLAVGVDDQLQLFWNTFTDLPYANHLKMTYFETLEAALEYARNKSG